MEKLMLNTVIVIISFLSNFLLGLFVLFKNPKSTTNRTFFVTALLLGFFAVINVASLHPIFFGQLALIRIDIFVGSLLFLFVYLTFDAFPENNFKKPSRWRKILVIYSLFVTALTLTPLIFNHLDITKTGVQPVPTPAIVLFVLEQATLLIGSFVILIRKFKKSTGLEREQFKFIFTGIFLSLGFITTFNLIFVQVFKVSAFIPVSSFATLFFTSAFAYAIVRKRLFDIKKVVARGVTYILFLGTLGGLYSLGLFLISDILLSGNTIQVEQVAINMVLSLLLVFTFQPLRRFFERITDKIFYRDKYDSQALLNQITQVLASEIVLDTILEKTLTMIAQAVRVNFGQYMIFEEGKVYKVEHYGKMPEQLISPAELKLLNRSMLVADELEAGERKNVMDKHHIRLSLVLRTKDEFVGFLLLGDKLSGDIYSTQDVELFQILANELAVAIVNSKAYEEIAQFNITLQDKVNQATARLRTANKHLKELDEAKDEFISMASHQLRTPLTTIKGYISMLQEGDAGKVSKEQEEFLEYAYDGSERMVGLISDLLNVSRMNSGKFMIDRTDVDPVAMVSDEVRQLVSHAEAKKLKLIWNPPKEKIPHVQLDDNKTRQVIMNFIDNAIYYTREGSVTVSLAQKGDSIELLVKDSGIGVPKEAQAKLFGKFFRAGNAQQVRPDGTGLGLYLAKRVVEDQGGSIIFESTEGKGSTFGFLLPIKAPTETKATSTDKKSKTDPAALAATAREANKVKVEV
jgi:signal transduction histidine kinase